MVFFMKIPSVKKGSQAESKGLRAGDKIIAINNGPARDCIDLIFYGSQEFVRLTIHRGTYEFVVGMKGEEDFGIIIEPMDIKLCRNHCPFCYVDQNPAGMRQNIYIKDDDYRLSYLNSSYITLTNLKEPDYQRIVAQRLTPLYVSVLATDVETRLKLLGIKKDDNLMENMDRLLKAGIKMHCKIVICPGINDGEILEQTINDLYLRYSRVLSVAVVPVGLTKHRESFYPLKAIDEEDALNTIEIVNRLHKSFARETDEGFVYCSDELYIRSGQDIPDIEYYDDFPQLENGVGMLRNFLNSASNIEERLGGGIKRKGNFVFITGMSMSPYIKDLSRRISEFPGINVRVVSVRNTFLGESVTVSGLLTGEDIQSALTEINPDETIVFPPNCLNESGVFLDDVSPSDISNTLGVKVISGDYDPLNIFI